MEAAPATAEVADGDTLNEALKELYPLLDKVDIPVEEKFDITMKFGSPAKALAQQFRSQEPPVLLESQP